MKVISRSGRLKEIEMVEAGSLFKCTYGYYLATDEYAKDNRRLCVNVESGVIVPFQKNTGVETVDYATIEIGKV